MNKKELEQPKAFEKFYYIDSDLDIREDYYVGSSINMLRVAIGNYFLTEEEAEAEAEKILVRRMLENIARRLNKGEGFDWKDINQDKYCLAIDGNTMVLVNQYGYKYQGVIYCLDKNFKNVAIKEIGEERLKKYLRGE